MTGEQLIALAMSSREARGLSLSIQFPEGHAERRDDGSPFIYHANTVERRDSVAATYRDMGATVTVVAA